MLSDIEVFLKWIWEADLGTENVDIVRFLKGVSPKQDFINGFGKWNCASRRNLGNLWACAESRKEGFVCGRKATWEGVNSELLASVKGAGAMILSSRRMRISTGRMIGSQSSSAMYWLKECWKRRHLWFCLYQVRWGTDGQRTRAEKNLIKPIRGFKMES